MPRISPSQIDMNALASRVTALEQEKLVKKVYAETAAITLPANDGANGSLTFSVPTGWKLVGVASFRSTAWECAISRIEITGDNSVWYYVFNAHASRQMTTTVQVWMLCMKADRVV